MVLAELPSIETLAIAIRFAEEAIRSERGQVQNSLDSRHLQYQIQSSKAAPAPTDRRALHQTVDMELADRVKASILRNTPLAADREAERAQRTANNRNSKFFQLPAEIRNQIYELAFSDHVPLGLNNKYIHMHVPGLLTACKQSYTEGLNIWYSCAQFYVRNTARLRSWLRSLPLEKANLIDTIHHTGVKKSGPHATYTGQQFLDRMARLRQQLALEGIVIGEGVIMAPVDIERTVWTANQEKNRRIPTWDWNNTNWLTDEDDDQE